MWGKAKKNAPAASASHHGANSNGTDSRLAAAMQCRMPKKTKAFGKTI